MIKHLWWHILKFYVALGLHMYFRQIRLVGAHYIPRKGPVIFLCNHQNALVDALLMATVQKRAIHSLTRGDIFKKKFIRWLLSTINMVPVYRIRDGWQSLQDNAWTFTYCADVLHRGGCIFLFPEGNHHWQRRLRPLSKGFTRILAETLKKYPTLPLKLVPVGINYTHPQNFGGSVSIYFGPPLEAPPFQEADFQTWASQVRSQVAGAMQSLITHVTPQEEYASLVAKLEAHGADFLRPEQTNRLLEKIKAHPEAYRAAPVHTPRNTLSKVPVWIFHSLPLVLWHRMKKGIRDHVFLSTAKIGLGISVFPLFLLLQSAGIAWLTGSALNGGLVAALSVLVLLIYREVKWR